ncbi:MAG: S9 family peptidase [Betaproteobacteria bacterium]
MRRRASAALLAAAGLAALAGCSEAPRHRGVQQAALPPLLQASAFARGQEPSAYRLSPDGAKLAWMASWRLRSTLHVRDLASGTTKRFGGGAQVGHWSADGRWLLYERHAGSEDTHVYALDTHGDSEPIDLTPYPGVKARLHQMNAGTPGSVLVAHNRRNPKLYDLYRLDLASGAETLLAENPGDAVAPLTSPAGELRGWQRSREAQRPAAHREAPLATRRAELGKTGFDIFRSLGATPDGQALWALSNRGRDRVALVLAHPRLGWERVVFEDPHVDVLDVDMSRLRNVPLIARALPGAPRMAILDDALRADLQGIAREQAGEAFSLDIVDADAAERRLLVLARSAKNRRYYVLDRAAGSFSLLAQAIPAELERQLAPVQPVLIAASDGMALRGYLTRHKAAPGERLPLVLHIHGGPWQRTAWGDPGSSEDAQYAQFLANRGYAVLQVDFRGSAGYGRRHMQAGIGEFAGRMQQDLVDAVQWAVDSGIADPQAVAVAGWSYGGYAALVGLTMTPARFACGISINGPTDLASLIESFPPYWQTDLSMWHDFVGDPSIDEDRADMAQRSPLTHAARLVSPVLVIQGAKDVRVRVDQAERMVQALRRAGKPVEYLRIEDMGHGTGWWVHRLQVLRASERFLAKCLGGRASRLDPWEPVGAVWARLQR